MAIPNKIIFNPASGQQIKFLHTARDTQGAFLEMETTYRGESKEPAPHYHPRQVEDFTVIEGELAVRIDGRVIVLRKGDTLQIPKNKVHSMWNASSTEAIVNWRVTPALETEYFLETAMGLAVDKKANKAGMPGLLQLAIMGHTFSEEFRLPKPPYVIQKILFASLYPVALLAGYRATYKKYID